MKFSLKKNVLEEKSEKSIIRNKVLLIWGSQNVGKSVIATFLAKELAKKHKDKNIALLYTEEHLPIIPCFFPDKKLDNVESLGVFYTPVNISKNFLLENLTTVKGINNLAVLGFLKREHFAMYPSIKDTLIEQLFRRLKEEFDFIIIDGATFFQGNQLTFQGFDFADIHLKVIENDIKSLSYFSSAENFLQSVGHKMKNTKVILNKGRSEVYNNADFVIDFSDEVYENCKMGDIFKISDKKFLGNIDKIIKEVF